MKKIVLEAAPTSESIDRVGDRFVVIALRRVSSTVKCVPEIDVIANLRERSFFGDEPSETEWSEAREKLTSDLARALDLALDLDLARARALALARALDLDLARALDLDLVDDLLILLGDRLDAIPTLDARILRAIEVEKLFGLDMSNWHCGTTHCRSGSACVLHPLGAELEFVFGNWMAGALIYKKSTGKVPNFFASNDEAMADIRKCAAKQVAASHGAV